MPISTGDRLPEAALFRMGDSGPEQISTGDLTRGRKVVIFAIPGAFTPTCDAAHMPSFIRTKDEFTRKGVEEIVCVAVNDPFVLRVWAQATGADKAGITVLGDPAGDLTDALGLAFDAPARGLIGRSMRYAMLVEDGVIKVLHLEESPGSCGISAGEGLLDAI
ncbi:MAG: peroxiredoxin [Gemmobacter sp.]